MKKQEITFVQVVKVGCGIDVHRDIIVKPAYHGDPCRANTP